MQKGKHNFSGLGSMSGTGERGWGRMSSPVFVYFEFCAMCVFILHCAVYVQRISLAFRCLLLELYLIILLPDAEPWLM